MNRLRAQYSCPAEFALDVIGGKWKTVILCWLKERPHRYGELRAQIPAVSDKVLTERLQDLEGRGLICKEAVNGTSAHHYRLTERGETLRPLLDALYRWGEEAAADWHVQFTMAAHD